MRFFGIKALLLVTAAVIPFFLLLRWRRTFQEPSIAFSSLKSFGPFKGRAAFANIPQKFIGLALLAFALAFIDPHFFVSKPHEPGAEPSGMPTEGIAIYLILDQSGSMTEQVPYGLATGRGRMISKIDLLKLVTRRFIEGDPQLGLPGRPNDLIGLVYFARAARVQAPLTLDHQAILQELAKFKQVGSMDEDGTSIGYAIYKTANMIAATRHYAQELIGKGEPAYTIKNSVMILITDGMQDPNPLDKGKRLRNMDVPEAAAYAKAQGIRLYIVNVEPKLATEEFAPYRHIMQRAAQTTGGKFYMADSTTSLDQIYQDIDKLEKSKLPEPPGLDKELRPDLYRRLSLYPYLIAAGLLSLLAAMLLEATLLRRVP